MASVMRIDVAPKYDFLKAGGVAVTWLVISLIVGGTGKELT